MKRILMAVGLLLALGAVLSGCGGTQNGTEGGNPTFDQSVVGKSVTLLPRSSGYMYSVKIVTETGVTITRTTYGSGAAPIASQPVDDEAIYKVIGQTSGTETVDAAVTFYPDGSIGISAKFSDGQKVEIIFIFDEEYNITSVTLSVNDVSIPTTFNISPSPSTPVEGSGGSSGTGGSQPDTTTLAYTSSDDVMKFVSTICRRMAECFSMTVQQREDCGEGVGLSVELTDNFGIEPANTMSLEDVSEMIEENESPYYFSVNGASYENCIYDLNDLSCAEIETGYNMATPSNYSHVENFVPHGSYTCSSVYTAFKPNR